MNRLFFLLLITLIFSCSTIERVSRLNKEGFSFVVNQIDTLKFDKLYLDKEKEHKFTFDKENKIIHYSYTNNLDKLLSIEEVEKLYGNDTTKVAFIIFNGELFSSSDKEKIYFQYSLINEVDRIKKGTMDGIGCRPIQGDIIIIK